MKKIVQFPDHEQVRIEAAAWVAKLDAGNLTAYDLGALRAWANSSAYHHEALESAATQWDDLNVLALYRQTMDIPGSRRGWLIRGAIAASFILAAALSYVYAPVQPDPMLATNGIYTTGPDKQRVVALADGSSVSLNINSQVEVSYSETNRALKLVRGEAFFDVAKNPEKVFMVSAREIEFIAIGTAFSIFLEEASRMKLVVSEGRVGVEHKGSNPVVETFGAGRPATQTAEPRIILAGQAVSYVEDQPESIETLQIQEVDRRLAWRTGMLVFDGQRLDQVTAEISRYAPLEVVILDPELRQLAVGGYFRTGDIDALLKTLASDFGIEVVWVEPKLVHLSMKSE